MADLKNVSADVAGYEILGVLFGVTHKNKGRIIVNDPYHRRIIIGIVILIQNGGKHLNAQPVAVDQRYSCFGRVYRKSFFIYRVKNVLERLCVRRYLWHIYAFHVKGPYYIVQSSDMILVRMGANHIIYGRISEGLYVIYHIGPGLICSRVYEQSLAVWQLYKLAVSLTNVYKAYTQFSFVSDKGVYRVVLGLRQKFPVLCASVCRTGRQRKKG